MGGSSARHVKRKVMDRVFSDTRKTSTSGQQMANNNTRKEHVLARLW